jgi:hypothetical protein
MTRVHAHRDATDEEGGRGRGREGGSTRRAKRAGGGEGRGGEEREAGTERRGEIHRHPRIHRRMLMRLHFATIVLLGPIVYNLSLGL